MPTRSTQKILIFCPPFDGHLNVLKDLVLQSPDDFEWKIVITGWKNMPVEVDGLDDRIIVLGKLELKETDPALWTFPRVVDLLDECLAITKKFQPDLIIYDFFSLEGYLMGKLLNIPVWASIPAFLGSFTARKYLTNKLQSVSNKSALKIIREQYGITITVKDVEMISDGIHLPGDVNIVWSYQSITPRNFKANRHDRPYVFIGTTKVPAPHTHSRSKTKKPTIYLSLGTVVMNNLWDQQEETRRKLTAFICELANLWKERPRNIVFVSQNKAIMDHYPSNWSVQETVDQVMILEQADVFVTHGGSNSFHESIRAQTPMVVIPFFGDQPLVAKTVVELGVGINLVPNASIDTNAQRDHLNHDLVISLDQAAQTILADDSYQSAIKHINLTHSDVYKLLGGKIDFNEGDLLYGTNVARQKYVTEHALQDEFTILEFKAFSELAPYKHSLPRIVDIYHDVILDEEYFKSDSQSGMTTYIERLKDYKQYLAGETDFEKMCIKGLDYFTQYYKVHFILSDYDPAINSITKAEIDYVLRNEHRFRDNVTFYRKTQGGYWIPVPYSEVSIY